MSLKSALLDLLFPPKCVFCRKLLPGGNKDGGICVKCAASLPYTDEPRAERSEDFFDFCLSPLYYRGIVRDSILRFKFRGAASYAGVYSRLAAEAVKAEPDASYDIITWAPVSRKRLKKRGYDQARLIAEGMAELLGSKCLPILKKSKHTPPQSGLEGAEKRRENVSGAYEMLPGRSVDGMRILLVDDVMTTGSTLSECTRTLLMAGAESVFCVTLARTE